MDLSTGLQMAELIVITLGLLGGLVQLRQMRIVREREAAMALLQSFMVPEFARSFATLMNLPENLTAERKLAPYFREVRARNDHATIAEWCEWLADQLGAQEQGSPPVPAHVAHKDWKPADSRRRRISAGPRAGVQRSSRCSLSASSRLRLVLSTRA